MSLVLGLPWFTCLLPGRAELGHPRLSREGAEGSDLAFQSFLCCWQWSIGITVEALTPTAGECPSICPCLFLLHRTKVRGHIYPEFRWQVPLGLPPFSAASLGNLGPLAKGTPPRHGPVTQLPWLPPLTFGHASPSVLGAALSI